MQSRWFLQTWVFSLGKYFNSIYVPLISNIEGKKTLGKWERPSELIFMTTTRQKRMDNYYVLYHCPFSSQLIYSLKVITQSSYFHYWCVNVPFFHELKNIHICCCNLHFNFISYLQETYKAFEIWQFCFTFAFVNEKFCDEQYEVKYVIRSQVTIVSK